MTFKARKRLALFVLVVGLADLYRGGGNHHEHHAQSRNTVCDGLLKF